MAAVVLNWHGFSETTRCIEGLLASQHKLVDIVVVDNGSFDGTLREIEHRWPQIKTIQLPTNIGYTGGNNAGIREALSRAADYVFVVNNDADIAPGTLAALLLEARTGVAAIGPTVYYRDQPSRIQSAGGRYDSLRGLALPLQQSSSQSPVDWLSGSAILLSREALAVIGGFDPRFFAYLEDVDWCLRAQEAGFRVAHVPEASASHGNGAGAPWSFMQFLITRNRIWVAMRHSHGLKRYVALGFLALVKTPIDVASCLKARDWTGAIATAKGLLWHIGAFRRTEPTSLVEPPAHP